MHAIDLRIALSRLAVIALVGLAMTAHAAPADDRPPVWANDFIARLEALALLQTLNAELLDASARTLAIPHAVLEHRAVLTLPDGTPISQVIETYTEQVLAFPQPRPIR